MKKFYWILVFTFLMLNTAFSQVKTSENYRITILSTMLTDIRGVGEWGFAALIEVDGNKILFDTGARPETVLKNAEELRIDLSTVEHVYLSHNHWDHVGGLITLRKNLMATNPKALSIAHVGKGAFYSRPSANGAEGNGMIDIKAEYESLGGKFIIHEKSGEIFPGMWNTGPVTRVHNERNWSGAGKIIKDGKSIEDNIPEDQSIALSTSSGWVLISGCGHAGIINTMDHIRKNIQNKAITVAIGGFHLLNASDETLDWTAKQMKRNEVVDLIGAHCTGVNALYSLRSLLNMDRKNAVVGAVGTVYSSRTGITAGRIAR